MTGTAVHMYANQIPNYSQVCDFFILDGVQFDDFGNKRAIVNLFKWARTTSINGFSWCACERTCICVRKLVEAKLTIKAKVKVVSLDE